MCIRDRSFGLLLLSAIVFAPTTRALLHFFRVGNLGTLALGLVAVAFGILMVWKGDQLVVAAASQFSPKLSVLGARIALRIREFRSGLHAIHDVWSLLYAIVVSVSMWMMIALAYFEVLHSYGSGPLDIPIPVSYTHLHRELLSHRSRTRAILHPGKGNSSFTTEARRHGEKRLFASFF